MPLPPLPGHRLETLSETSPPAAERGFVYVRKLTMRATFADGTVSEPFTYDVAGRSKLDAVVVVPHYLDESGRRMVVLRSAVRPPAAVRPREAWPIPEKPSLGEMWEVPAGLVEEDERSPEGLKSSAARELMEEAGFDVQLHAVQVLGPSSFPTPGLIGERHFYFHVEVDPRTRLTPPEDGSILEKQAAVIDVSLEDALAACRAGEVEDAKTELALRRLAEFVGETAKSREHPSEPK